MPICLWLAVPMPMPCAPPVLAPVPCMLHISRHQGGVLVCSCYVWWHLMGSCGWQGQEVPAALPGSCHTSILGHHHLWECGTPLKGVPHSHGSHNPTQWHTNLLVSPKINSGTCQAGNQGILELRRTYY